MAWQTAKRVTTTTTKVGLEEEAVVVVMGHPGDLVSPLPPPWKQSCRLFPPECRRQQSLIMLIVPVAVVKAMRIVAVHFILSRGPVIPWWTFFDRDIPPFVGGTLVTL